MRYITAEKRFCFAALLETVFLKYGYNKFDQIIIADKLGITLPGHDPLVKKLNNVILSDDPFKWGMNINPNELQYFLENTGLDLKFTFLGANRFEDWEFEDQIVKNLDGGNIICTFEYNTLFNKTNKEYFGHAILLKDNLNNRIEIFDPGPENSGHKIIDYFDLYIASRRMNGGLWIFK